MTSGSAALAAEVRKHNCNNVDLGWSCIPIAVVAQWADFVLPCLSFETFHCTQLIEMFQQQRLEAREMAVAPEITKPNSEEIIGSATTFTEHCP